MHYYGAKELADSFRTVRNNTIIIAEEIGEEHYGSKVAADTRTVAQLLTHLAAAPGFQHQIHGLEKRNTLEGFDFGSRFAQMAAKEAAPASKAEIIERLRHDGEHFAQWLATLSDDFLAERVTLLAGMTPPDKSRFEMLLGVKEHEMHHRGQLMLMERMFGLVPHLTRAMRARMAAMQATKASA